MTGYELAQESALLLQDRMLIDALKNKTDDEYAQRIYRALRDAYAEVARDFPMTKQKAVTATDRVIPYSAILPHGMIRVLRVAKDGRDVPFSTDYCSIRVRCDGVYTVTYAEDNFDADLEDEVPAVREVGVPMLIHLTARNYCIMCGRMDEAAVYDSRYGEYAESLRLKRRAHVPARKFV